MKKEKLSLKELEVNSFVTELNENENKTVEGGVTPIPGLITSGIASYLNCKKVGEDLGQAASNAFCGDSMGLFCKLITV